MITQREQSGLENILRKVLWACIARVSPLNFHMHSCVSGPLSVCAIVTLFCVTPPLAQGCEMDQTPGLLVDFRSLSQIIPPLAASVCLISSID